ncbi:hypothetical protein EPUS_04143 [Endocarpon pusillum Z07020]|uniref:FAD-binding domain-containing protein n=1 Tax=Endocarpon pusillum (strain Z07020 / HMAS-L-300199) TaxID=1263415 RepID=U1GW20_ENDPU|nr:uncharacterized protein EPUS_04143 [Endocarpon pusillum Z07020]ERF76286.1 hypothetical protein EPUS_04143 [Endocarpon pusillum Z07020]
MSLARITNPCPPCRVVGTLSHIEGIPTLDPLGTSPLPIRQFEALSPNPTSGEGSTPKTRHPTQLKGNLETYVGGESESSSDSDVETTLVEARRVVNEGINLTAYPERRMRPNGMSCNIEKGHRQTMGDRCWEIVIIGAGPTGCMLACPLLQASIPRLSVTIFGAKESTTSVRTRPHAPAVRGHLGSPSPKSGLWALKKAQFYEKFLNYAQYDGSFFELWDKGRTTYFRRPCDRPGTKNGKPEVDRAQLRSILLDALPAKIVHLGHRPQ